MPDDNLTLPHQPAPDLPTGEPFPSAARYVLGEEIARGGMGAIYRAADTVLNREVAIKVLQEQFPADSPLARRFVEEAQITAQLQHPGIPPVQDQGTFADGRPFLAMKLIKGQSLADLLHKRPDPTHDLGRFLTVFESIGQAVGFAHAQGIIHRDLKPANVMVGEFGEVQVMDWGLAKQLASRAASAAGSSDDASKGDTRSLTRHGSPDADPDRTTDQTADLSTDERTRAGQALGTPAFMPPEQARGEVERIDFRSDVFGLGAILCAVLTGQPPFLARRSAEALEKARRGDLADAFARLDTCGADADLIALCKRCLSAEPEARPTNGGEVAALVSQYRASVEERLRTAERNRAAAEAKAIEQRKKRRVQLALAASVLVIACGGAAFGWWADRIAGEKREAALRQEAEDAARAAEEKTRIARNADTLEATVIRCESALQRGDVKGVETALTEFDKRSHDGGGEAFAARVEQCRTDLPLLIALNKVDQHRWTPLGNKLPEPSEVVDRWNAALVAHGLDVRIHPTDELVKHITPSHLRSRIEYALDLWLMVTREARVRELLKALDSNPYRNAMRDATFANRLDEVAMLAAQPEAEHQPASFAATFGYHQGIPDVRRREILEIVVRALPGNVMLLLTMGFTYPGDHRENVHERIRWYQAALTADPSNYVAYVNLGVALEQKGDRPGALAAFKEAIRLDPKLTQAHFNLGVALEDSGDLPGAIAAYRDVIRLDPNNAKAHSNLGNALRNSGDLPGANTAWREAIRLDPKLTQVHTNLGIALAASGDVPGAIAAHREAIRLDPNNAKAHYNLGNALAASGDLPGAIAAYKEAIRLDTKFAQAHYNLGVALDDSGDRPGAIAAWREAIRLDFKYAPAHINLGVALADSGDLPGAIAAYKEAIRLDPKYADAHSKLGVALAKSGDLDGAIAAWREAIRLDPKHAPAHSNLGLALAYSGDLPGAIAACKEAIRLDPKYAQAHTNLGLALAKSGDLDGAIASFEESLRLEPNDTQTKRNLAIARKLKAERDAKAAAPAPMRVPLSSSWDALPEPTVVAPAPRIVK